MNDDNLDFCDDVDEIVNQPPWKMLIVDDDHDIHAVTDLVMQDFSFEGRPVKLWHSYSGIEAKALLSEHHDIAIVFLDVVMESEYAGLEVVTYLRNNLNNHLSRIVLRTGQAGLAPEEKVIRQYDINDYREKSDLCERKLKTTVFSSLRNYRDLLNLETSRIKLKRTINTISQLHNTHNLESFAFSLQEQIKFLLAVSENFEDSTLTRAYAISTSFNDDMIKIMATDEGYHRIYSKNGDWNIPGFVKEKIDLAFSEKRSLLDERNHLGYSNAIDGGINILYLEFNNPIKEQDQEYLNLFLESALITYQCLQMHEEIKNSQQTTILLLGEAVEKRSQETGAHVQRVSETSAILARELGLSTTEVDRVRLAAPLHDVGKIGIPDAILNKPGKLNTYEWEIMKTHAILGRDLLSKSQSKVLEIASIIAFEHHESWDGTGYPRGLKCEETHIAGRIVAVADVMDALVNNRCYKQAWSFDEAFEYLLNEKGKRFDPQIVDIFISCKEEILSIYDRLKD